MDEIAGQRRVALLVVDSAGFHGGSRRAGLQDVAAAARMKRVRRGTESQCVLGNWMY